MAINGMLMMREIAKDFCEENDSSLETFGEKKDKEERNRTSTFRDFSIYTFFRSDI